MFFMVGTISFWAPNVVTYSTAAMHFSCTENKCVLKNKINDSDGNYNMVPCEDDIEEKCSDLKEKKGAYVLNT